PGPVDAARPGLWVCTALGSRGLSFATLCAELLAARWHGEPLPVPAAWARGLDTARLAARAAPDAGRAQAGVASPQRPASTT
ncbi:MAG: hypothetical protein EOO29_27810, partial [Comamonadaceae bacterium]